jgi:hypothetical protein
MGQNEIVVAVEQRQLMLQALFALAKGIHAPANGGHTLTEVKIEPLDHRSCVGILRLMNRVFSKPVSVLYMILSAGLQLGCHRFPLLPHGRW